MEYVETPDMMPPHQAVLTEQSALLNNVSSFLQRSQRRMVRCGNYTLDVVAGTIQWQHHPLALAREEHELLCVLLRRAGQILSRESLAAMLSTRVDRVDARMQALRTALMDAGVKTWLPHSANGLGYILWR